MLPTHRLTPTFKGVAEVTPHRHLSRRPQIEKEKVLQGGLEMRKLKIDDTTHFLLREAFKRDVHYESEPELFYLDLSSLLDLL